MADTTTTCDPSTTTALRGRRLACAIGRPCEHLYRTLQPSPWFMSVIIAAISHLESQHTRSYGKRPRIDVWYILTWTFLYATLVFLSISLPSLIPSRVLTIHAIIHVPLALSIDLTVIHHIRFAPPFILRLTHYARLVLPLFPLIRYCGTTVLTTTSFQALPSRPAPALIAEINSLPEQIERKPLRGIT